MDLECVNVHDRGSFIRSLAEHGFDGPLFVAAADLDLSEVPLCFKVVLLLPVNKQEYLDHVQERNKREANKADQREEKVFDGMTGLARERMVAEIDFLRRAGNVDELAKVILEQLGLEAKPA